MRIMLVVWMLFILTASVFAETVSSPSSLDTAKILMSQEKFADAIAFLEKITSDPGDARNALLMMSECYDELGKWDEALVCIEKAQAMSSDSVATRGVKLRLMDHYLAQGLVDKYQSFRSKLRDEFQSDAWRLYYIVGKRRVRRHEYSGAIPELKQAVSLGEGFKDPDVADANYRLLHCYVVEKQWKNAEEFGPMLIQKCPSISYKLQMEIGQCYQGQQEYEEAIKQLEAAAKLAPREDYYNCASIYRSLLDTYEDAGKLDEAISLAVKLNQEYPKESAWQWRLGWYYLQGKQYEKAAPLFKKVIGSSAKRWEIRKGQIFLGECMFNMGQGKEALDVIEAYFKDKPEMWDEHLLVKGAVLFHGPKDYDGCITAQKQILDQVAAGRKSDLVPTAIELIYESYGMMGKLERGAPMMEDQARKSNDPTLLCRVADDYFGAGNYKEARRLFREVMGHDNLLDAVRADSMYGLARCYWEMSLRSAARRLMQRISEELPDTERAGQARAMLSLWAEVR